MGIQINGNTDTISALDGSWTSDSATHFTGKVSIGGTLTYEDVTNIDSVGILTARNGIEVGGQGTNKSILFHEANNSPSNGDSAGEIKWASRVDKTVTAQIKAAAFNNNNGTDGVLTFWTANDTSSGDSANHLKETFRIDQLGRTLIGNQRTVSDLGYYDDLTINNSNAASGASGSAGITLVAGDSAWCGLNFGRSGDMDEGHIRYDNTNNAMIFGVGNGSERLRIASDGRIFTSGRTSYSGNTTCDDLVIGNGSGHRGIAISSGSSSEGGIHFGDGESGNSSYRGIIAYNHADDSMQFRTAAAERLRITGAGKIGIGVASPFNRFQCGSHTFSGGHGMYNDSRVGMSNHGNLTGLMLGSTYNDANHPEYGLVFVQGPSTSSYNVWSISPDGPAKGNSLNLHYLAQATNIHSPGNRKFEFTGGGYLLKPNHPCFRAGLSANTSFNNGAVVIFGDTSSDAGHFNRNGCYNASTGKFTAPVAGIYEFTVGAIIMNISSGTDMTDCFELYYQPSGGTGIRIAYSNRRGEYIADETGNAGYYTDWLVGCMVNMAANSTVWVENKKRAHTWHGNTDYCWFTGKLIA